MELNKIKLSPQVIADLYKNTLVEPADNKITGKINEIVTIEPAENPDTEKQQLNSEWKYLGQYKKNILLIVNYENTTYLPDGPLNFLTSVLGACKLNLGDIAILNRAHVPSNLYKNIQEKFKSTHIILFGTTPAEVEMPVNFPEFQVQPFNNCIFLHTPRLEQMEADKVLKSKLWVCLRKMFGV
jgi:hypothetical protein